MGDRRSNDYYDDDEEGYEQDEYEDEEEEERKPPPKPTKGEQDFLKFREGLKDKYRHNKTSKQPTQDKFGSFFGPSKPVIALRVIEETKSLKETSFQNSSAKRPSSSTSKGIASSSSSKHKSSNGYGHRPKVNEVKKKAQTLKEARDYSFLFSDDADLPEQNLTKNNSKPASHPRPDRASTSQAGNRQPIRSQSNTTSAASNARSSHSDGHRSAPPSDGHRSSARSNGNRSELSNGHRSSAASNGHRSEPSKEHRSAPSKQRQPLPQREKERPMQQRKPPLPPSKAPLKSVNGSSSNNRQNVVRKNPNMADPSSSVQRRPVQDGRRDPVQDKSRTGTRSVSSSKHQVSRQDEDINRRREMEKKKKRPLERGGDMDISSMIRDIMGYNPNKYAGRDDDDDSDMEVGFNVIQKEERMSSKIAKKEDEEELRLIEEEERRERERERMRKKQKKR